MRPSEAIVVLLEELDECKAEFGAEAHSNLDLVVRVIGMNADIIEFVYARLIWLQLLNIGSVRELHYPDWLANVLVVRKKNGK